MYSIFEGIALGIQYLFADMQLSGRRKILSQTQNIFSSSRFFPPILLEYFFFFFKLFNFFIFPLHKEMSPSILCSCLLVLRIWYHLCWGLYVRRFPLTWSYLHLQWFFFCQIPECFRKFDRITASQAAVFCLYIQILTENSEFKVLFIHPSCFFCSSSIFPWYNAITISLVCPSHLLHTYMALRMHSKGGNF